MEASHHSPTSGLVAKELFCDFIPLFFKANGYIFKNYVSKDQNDLQENK